MMYEEPMLKQKALSIIPVARLREEAKRNLDAYMATQTSSSAKSSNEPAFDFDDFLLIELLAWFKNEFFTWTDTPKCARCQTNESVRNAGMSGPSSDEEISGMAGRVEVYQLVLFLNL